MPPIVATIATLVAAAVGTGTSVYEATQQPGTPKLPGTAPLTSQQNRAQTAQISSVLPTLQSLTGGSLSPEYAAQYGATQTGLANNSQSAGNVQAAINQFFGLSAPGSTGYTPESVGSAGGTNILDLLRRATTQGSSPFGSSGSSTEDFKGLSA